MPFERNTEVFMAGSGFGRSQATVDVPTGHQHRIFTSALVGCHAVAMIARHLDGRSIIYLAHYPALMKSNLKQNLELQSLAFARHSRIGAKVSLLIALPGRWEKSSDKKWNLVPKEDEMVQQYGEAALVAFRNQNVVVKALAYNELIELGNHTKFTIDVPASSEAPIRYNLHATTYGDI